MSIPTIKLKLYIIVSDCVFPFSYLGEIFNTCTRKNSQNGHPWCATKVDKLTGDVVLGHWGDCNKNCIASGRWPEEQVLNQASLMNFTRPTVHSSGFR